MEIYLLIMGLLVVLSMANPIIKKEEINKLLFTAIAVILILALVGIHYNTLTHILVLHHWIDMN